MGEETQAYGDEGTAVGALPGPLVSTDWLAAHLGAPGLLVFDASVGAPGPVLDASGGAHRGSGTRIAGARVFDIDGALSDPTAKVPHTMPDAARFTDGMRALGLNDTDTVVVYDTAGIYSSARAWWMLRAMGFGRAAVLDGGLPAWTAAGLPVDEGRPDPSPCGDFTARPRPGLLVDAGTVAEALADPDAAVLDARTRGRFEGTEPEPRAGLRGGHMPGSVSLPFGRLQDEGRMLPPDELRAAFAGAAGDRERLYFSCGSGVTACVLALGAELAGYRGIAVYDGSWSEWGLPAADSADEADRPVVTGPGER